MRNMLKASLMLSALMLALTGCGETAQDAQNKAQDKEAHLNAVGCSFTKTLYEDGVYVDIYQYQISCDTRETTEEMREQSAALREYANTARSSSENPGMDQNEKSELETKADLAESLAERREAVIGLLEALETGEKLSREIELTTALQTIDSEKSAIINFGCQFAASGTLSCGNDYSSVAQGKTALLLQQLIKYEALVKSAMDSYGAKSENMVKIDPAVESEFSAQLDSISRHKIELSQYIEAQKVTLLAPLVEKMNGLDDKFTLYFEKRFSYQFGRSMATIKARSESAVRVQRKQAMNALKDFSKLVKGTLNSNEANVLTSEERSLWNDRAEAANKYFYLIPTLE